MLTEIVGYIIITTECQVIWWELKEVFKMKLSTRGRYGLKAMYQLALHYGEGPIALNNIAKKQGLSENYLEQLFSVLRKEGLIISVRGAQGGYMLAKDPQHITVGHILRTLEGNMAPVDCLTDENVKCDREDECATKFVYAQMIDSLNNVIDSITLQDMIDEQKKNEMIK